MKLPWLNTEESIQRMNELGAKNIPFFFLISYDKNKNLVIAESEFDETELFFTYPLLEKTSIHPPSDVNISGVELPPKSEYRQAFEKVQYHINRGDTYLLNLTFEIPISLTGSLQDVFLQARAPYKVYLEDHFTSFSPEPFIKIENNKAYTFPMKGTINAEEKDAEATILLDEKEKAEHYTIVDLLRNDMSQIGTHTIVNRFRYLSPVRWKGGQLLQVSSEIECQLQDNWTHHIGDLLFRVLPAGSISGAPKKRTLEIIRETEKHDREWYSGIAGVYKDKKLESSVLIRYIGKRQSRYFYKSGGGITHLSDWKKEYEEIRSKIYIPIG